MSDTIFLGCKRSFWRIGAKGAIRGSVDSQEVHMNAKKTSFDALMARLNEIIAFPGVPTKVARKCNLVPTG